MFASDLRTYLADCGDGVIVKADGREIRTAQVEGQNPPTLNLITNPNAEVISPVPADAPLSAAELAEADAALAEQDAEVVVDQDEALPFENDPADPGDPGDPGDLDPADPTAPF